MTNSIFSLSLCCRVDPRALLPAERATEEVRVAPKVVIRPVEQVAAGKQARAAVVLRQAREDRRVRLEVDPQGMAKQARMEAALRPAKARRALVEVDLHPVRGKQAPRAAGSKKIGPPPID